MISFQSEEDCDRVLKGGPWFVTNQLLAVEPWILRFQPIALRWFDEQSFGCGYPGF